MDDRALYEQLLALSEEEIAEIEAFAVPRAAKPYLPSNKATKADRAMALVKVAEHSPEIRAWLVRRLADPVLRWCAWGARQYGWVRVVGFQDKYKIRLSLDDVFVPLMVQPRAHFDRERRGKKDEHELHASEPMRESTIEEDGLVLRFDCARSAPVQEIGLLPAAPLYRRSPHPPRPSLSPLGAREGAQPQKSKSPPLPAGERGPGG